MKKPTPEDLKILRNNAGLTQTQAAELVCCGVTAWQKWEYGNRQITPGLYELLTLKLGLMKIYNFTDWNECKKSLFS